MQKMQRLYRRKLVVLVDSSGNNVMVAKRVKRFSYIFPLHDADGNEITEEQAARKGTKNTIKVRKNE